MTDLLARAIAEGRKLPPEVQDAIAWRILDDVADERLWDRQFAATSDEQWDRMAESVRRDIRAGNVEPIENAFPQ